MEILHLKGVAFSRPEAYKGGGGGGLIIYGKWRYYGVFFCGRAACVFPVSFLRGAITNIYFCKCNGRYKGEPSQKFQ